jgi:hypothetical protein
MQQHKISLKRKNCKSEDEYKYIGFEVLTAVGVKSTVFWVLMVCSLETGRCFGGIYCLQLQGQSIKQARNQQRQVGNMRYTALQPRRNICCTSNITINQIVNYQTERKCNIVSNILLHITYLFLVSCQPSYIQFVF